MANFNAFDAYEPARQAAYEQVGQMRQDRARVKAGQALQNHDYTGAAGELYGAGDLQAGQGVQQMEEHAQDRDATQARQGRLDKQAETDRLVGFLKDATPAIQQIPAPIGPDGKPDLSQRRQVYFEHIAPRLVKFGMPEEAVQEAGDHLDDVSLQAFGPDLDKHLQGVNLGGGGYGVFNQRTGEFTTKREPTQKAPPGYMFGPDGGLVIDPGYVSGQNQINDGRAAATAAHRAPPRGRAGGKGSSSGLPSGFVLD